MLKVRSVVALYEVPQSAEDALQSLQENGTSIQDVSIAALEGVTLSETKLTRPERYRGEQGAVWGAPWALFEDHALYDVLGLGTVRLGGPILFWMEAVLEREIAYQGVTPVGASLVSIGVPLATAVTYEQALKQYQSLLMVHGQSNTVSAARDTMATTLPASLMVHGPQTLPLFGLPQW